MEPKIPIYDVDNWHRVGRGRVLQFFATDDEIQEWLLSALPPEYGPYTLVGADLVQIEKKKYIQKGFEFGIDELKRAMYEQDETRWEYWIRSKVITPQLDFSRHKMISWILSYSGLVGLHHGSYNKNKWVDGLDASSIGIVDQVNNDKTGEKIQHKEYLNIFKKLNREIKNHLCYSSFWKYKDGSEREDFESRLMTEKAVRAYEEGMKFVNRPGRRLEIRGDK
jgi:hypothetical protein